MTLAAGTLGLEASTGAPAAAPYPVWYDVEPQARHRRLTVAFRAVLAVPHLIVLSLLGQVVYLITIVGWLSIVFSGRYDRGLASLPLMYMRWQARVTTYLTLLRDEYPPFGDGAYPISFEIPHQEQRSRLRTFFRAVLILPQVLVLYVLLVAWQASVVLAWFAILFSGVYPEGLRRFVVGLNRWLLRVTAYALLLRDEYPPFSLGLDEPRAHHVPEQAQAEAPVDFGLTGFEPTLPVVDASEAGPDTGSAGIGYHPSPWRRAPELPQAAEPEPATLAIEPLPTDEPAALAVPAPWMSRPSLLPSEPADSPAPLAPEAVPDVAAGPTPGFFAWTPRPGVEPPFVPEAAPRPPRDEQTE